MDAAAELRRMAAEFSSGTNKLDQDRVGVEQMLKTAELLESGQIPPQVPVDPAKQQAEIQRMAALNAELASVPKK